MTELLPRIPRVAVILVVALVVLLVPALAQGSAGMGGGNNGGNSSGGGNGPNSPSNNQGSQQPAGNNQGASAPGITGGGSGSMAIESVLFAYKALGEDARNISDAVSGRVNGKIVVVATPADFASFLQWRTTMYQAALLDKRANSAIAAMRSGIPSSFGNVPKNAQTLGGPTGPFLGSPSDVQTLIQTLASIFAVNESVSASYGSLTSTPLTNLLAAKVQKAGAKVYVPAVYPPNLFQNDGLENTFIGQRLDKLEQDRQDAVAAAQEYAQALNQANTILSGSASLYTQQQKTDASNFKQNYASVSQLRAAELSSAIAAIDNFESTLLTGQPAASSTQANGQGQQQQTNPANGPQAAPNAAAPGAGTPTAGPAQKPTPPVGAPASPNPTSPNTTGQAAAPGPNQGQGNGNTSGPNGPSPATPTYPSTAGTPLQQMLASDLLARQIWGGKEPDEAAQNEDIVILVVQTLESGGEQMTKSNLFMGSRVYFNGGAVATFALYGIDGVLQCGGFAYAYGGYSKDDDFGDALKRQKLNPTGEIESNCEQ